MVALHKVRVQEGRSILSLIANVKRSSDVIAQVFEILAKEEIQVATSMHKGRLNKYISSEPAFAVGFR